MLKVIYRLLKVIILFKEKHKKKTLFEKMTLLFEALIWEYVLIFLGFWLQQIQEVPLRLFDSFRVLCVLRPVGVLWCSGFLGSPVWGILNAFGFGVVFELGFSLAFGWYWSFIFLILIVKPGGGSVSTIPKCPGSLKVGAPGCFLEHLLNC